MLLSGTGSSSRRPSLHTTIPLPAFSDSYSDSRTHGYQGSNRHIRMPHASSFGGGSIAKNEDNTRCVVAGKESLRVLRISDPADNAAPNPEHRFIKGHGGHRIDASRNMWNGSGLKIDSAATDVVWCHGPYSSKILTSARNGELILWDLNRSGNSKYERRARDHVRSIHTLSYSVVSQNYCTTGSADGDLRVWDMRDLSKSIMRIHHPAAVRAVSISPVASKALQAITGLDNGSIYRWDLRMGQRGQLDRIPVAHAGPILSLDWAPPPVLKAEPSSAAPTANTWIRSGLLDDLSGPSSETWNGSSDSSDGRMGWLASGGLDRIIKVWSLSTSPSESHISRKAAYTLHTSFPIRRVLWRPSYDCELAVVSNVEFGSAAAGPNDSTSTTPAVASPYLSANTLNVDEAISAVERMPGSAVGVTTPVRGQLGDPVEIWDVRRGFLAKWTVRGSAAEGGVTDVLFADSHALWAQHCSGSFSQFDLRQASKSLDAIPRSAISWNAVGSLAFIADKPKRWEVPFDDVNPEARQGLHNRRAKHKALGDRSYSPASQTFGTFVNNDSEEEVELFVKLARGYKFDGNDRASICAHNAGVAMNAGKESAAQAWFLLAALLMDIVTPPVINTQTPALSPLPLISPHLPHSTSAPAAVPTLSASNRGTAGISLPHRPSSFDTNVRAPAGSNTNPGNSSRHSPDRQHSASASSTGFLSPSRTTPASSTAPSPHRKPVTLPVPVSIFARRGSGAGLPTHPVHPSSSIPSPRSRLMSTNSRRKPSFSNSTPSLYSVSLQSEAAEGKTGSGLSLKHVGDGALDDSDDEEEGSSHGGSDIETDDENIGGGFDDNWGSVRSLKSDNGGAPSLTAETPSSARHPFVHRSSSTSANTHSNPSPLSRVAGQQTWTEDEDERGNDEDNEDSPSPASSSDSDGTDLSDNDQPDSRVNSKGKTSSMKRSRSNRTTRSRSSTVASLSVEAHLAAPGSSLSIHLPKLTKQESSSSIRTVTAVNSPHPDNESQKGIPHILTRDDTIRDLSHSNSLNHDDAHSYKPPSSFRQAHKRVRSSLSTEFFIDREVATPSAVSNDEDLIEVKTPASWYEETRAMELESHMRDAGWDALRETLEIYADEGDVQMCTMLSLVAAQELKVNRSRLLRFLEAYIEMLVRLRLHESAAYMRKNAPVDEIRNITGLETTIYTSCGRCRKPLIHPASSGPAKLNTTPISNTNRHGIKTVIVQNPRGNYAFCSACREATTKCSICHLPVRALLFKCAVCMHGGHQDCYRMYYMRRPMLPVPKLQASHSVKPPLMNPSSSPSSQPSTTRERRMSKSGESGLDDILDGFSPPEGHSEPGSRARDESVVGHPCAAGCGHFCWAANESLYTRTDL